jgi:hypothetical protein
MYISYQPVLLSAFSFEHGRSHGIYSIYLYIYIIPLPFNQTATEFQICQYVPLGRSQGPGRVQRAHGGAQTRTSGSFSVVMMIILSIIQQLWIGIWIYLGEFWVRCGIVARCSKVAPGWFSCSIGLHDGCQRPTCKDAAASM